jgi:predicted nucleic acid-binding protein
MVFVYLDTCVWLSALIRAHPKHNIAWSLFEEARRGDSIILVSHHVLSEIVDVLKRKLVIKQSVRDNPSIQELEKLVKSKYRTFSLTLLQLPNVRIKNPNTTTHKIFRNCFSLLFRYFGDINQENKCPICGNTYDFIECDSVYEKDVLHALLAWNLNSDRFVTFDKDFEQLKNEASLTPMSIEVM